MIHPGYIADKVNEYRLRAAECRNHADKAPNRELRDHYLWLAEMWQQLAETRAASLKAAGPPD
ncbi:MAG TPA: hypothetical protein VGH65_02895 [Verrucomicrobiaceae bacterium]